MRGKVSSELFRIVMEAAWNTTADVMVVVDEDGFILACNDQVEPRLGWVPSELIGQRIEVLVPHGKRGEHRALVDSYHAHPVPRRMGGDIVLFALTASAEEVPVDISLSSVRHDGELYTLATVRDATQRFAYEEEMRRLGFRDSLTGVYNRHYFDEELLRLQRGRTWPVGVLMADLDGLKQVNDVQGHHAGDLLIQSAARALCGAVRQDDVVARLGGDEFAVLLPGLTSAELELVSQRVEAACNATAPVLRMSTGWASASEGTSLRSALREADARMYEVKRQRR